MASDASGNPVLARPFYNVVLDQEDALLASSPGLLIGSINAETSSSVLAAEAYLRSGILAGRGYNLDLVGGYHFLRLDDDLSVFSDSTSIDPGGAVPVGTIIDVFDEFGAENEFHGGVARIGWRDSARQLDVERSGQVQRGQHASEPVNINGYQSVAAPGSPTAAWPGGLFDSAHQHGQLRA